MPKALKRFLLIAATLFLLLLLAIAFIASPDQFRSIPEPHYFGSVTKSTLTPISNLDSPTSSTLAQVALSNIAWPQPDLSHLDTETRQAIQECSDELLELSKQFMLVPGRTKEMTIEDAVTEFTPLDQAFMEIMKKYAKVHSTHRPIVNELMARNQEVRRKAHVGVCVEHENWLEAGFTQSMSLNPFIKRDNIWDVPESDRQAGIYYLRRGGIKGRLTLVGMSIHRKWREIMQPKDNSATIEVEEAQQEAAQSQ